MLLSCYATEGTSKVSQELACIYYLLQTLCSTHEEWTCWQKTRGRFQGQIPTAESVSSAVGYSLPSFAVNFLDHTRAFQWFSSFMEILLILHLSKTSTTCSASGSVVVRGIAYSNSFNSVKSHGSPKGGEKNLWIWHSTKVSGWC